MKSNNSVNLSSGDEDVDRGLEETVFFLQLWVLFNKSVKTLRFLTEKREERGFHITRVEVQLST